MNNPIKKYFIEDINKKITFKERIEKYGFACFNTYIIPYVLFILILLKIIFSIDGLVESIGKGIDNFSILLFSIIVALFIIFVNKYKEMQKNKLIKIFKEK